MILLQYYSHFENYSGKLNDITIITIDFSVDFFAEKTAGVWTYTVRSQYSENSNMMKLS